MKNLEFSNERRTARRSFFAKLAAAVAALAGLARIARTDASSPAPLRDIATIPKKKLREADFYKPHKWAG